MLGGFVIFHFLEGNFEDIGVATSFLISVDFFDLKKIKRVSTEIVYTNAIADAIVHISKDLFSVFFV